MALQSFRDIQQAVELGKTHYQAGFKNTGVTGDNQFQDWAFVGGKPGIDPRIGTALAWTSKIAEKNNAIYFPDAPTGNDIVLTEWGMRTVASSTNQTATPCMLLDLLGYYPLIDGDSTDPQELTGSGLPRYADGDGVLMCLVNHLVPMAAACIATLNYTDSANVARTVNFGVQNAGQNKVCSGLLTQAGAVSAGASYAIPMDGRRGAKSAQLIQFLTAPSGLFCLYFFKPIAWLNTVAPTIIDNSRPFAIREFGFDTAQLPRIYNGAHLALFHMPTGAGRSSGCSYFINFVWG